MRQSAIAIRKAFTELTTQLHAIAAGAKPAMIIVTVLWLEERERVREYVAAIREYWGYGELDAPLLIVIKQYTSGPRAVPFTPVNIHGAAFTDSYLPAVSSITESGMEYLYWVAVVSGHSRTAAFGQKQPSVIGYYAVRTRFRQLQNRILALQQFSEPTCFGNVTRLTSGIGMARVTVLPRRRKQTRSQPFRASVTHS